MQRMKVFIEELDKSRFYHHFQHLLRTSSISEHVHKVLGKHNNMQMIIYGILVALNQVNIQRYNLVFQY